jgi:tetratricopeptide (TPR) repeat protein
MPGHIFISHASKDDEFVKELREALEANELPVWIDARNLRGGAKLAPEINEAIEQAGQFIVVLSPNTINSPWVRREIQKALEVERQRNDNGFRAIPLLLPGIEPSALEYWFDEEPVGVKFEVKTGALSEALPSLLEALSELLPEDPEPLETTPSTLVEELILTLSDPKVQENGSQQLATATAALLYEPADESLRAIESKRFRFTAPLGLIKAEDLRWYLEDYYRWPTGGFKARADRIEAQLPQWGRLLYDAAAQTESAKEALKAWQNAANGATKRFSVMVDRDLPEGASQEEQAIAGEAANRLLSLPWELLHDGSGWLFRGKHSARVRRRLPNRTEQKPAPHDLPIRILLVSPRPEEESYIDHRLIALPLLEAVKSLGALVELTMLSPPTFDALQGALKRATEANRPFDVVHFDGRCVYDRKAGLVGLGFEDTKDKDKLEERAMQLIHAEEIATVMRDYRVPLTFLETHQGAQTELDPTASVAAKLLEEGGASVVALQPCAPVGAAQRFFTAFYQELARGAHIGVAMSAGQRALSDDKIPGAGDLHLQDWFVPVLYQEEQDSPLVKCLPSEQIRLLQAKQRQLSLGALPDPPAHGFVGRSRELLKLERLLSRRPYAVVRAEGGEGKTTLAVELARHLTHTRCFRRAAFVNLEHCTDARSVLDSLGRQLLPEGENWSAAQYGNDLKRALQDVDRPLRNHPTLIVLDNCESVLHRHGTGSGSDLVDADTPGAEDQVATAPRTVPAAEIFDLCSGLLDAHPATRIVFTSRKSLPAPFAQPANEVRLEGLRREDAVALLSQAMKHEGLTPRVEDSGDDEEEVAQLVEAVNRHARALALLAREVARQGARATTEDMRRLMAELDARRPGARENSLYVSVELSLRRLPPELRGPCRALGVFHGGAYLPVLGQVLGVDDQMARRLSRALIELSLAEEMGYGHLRLNPALTNYLLGRMDAGEQEAARDRWGAAMRVVTNYLNDQQFKDAQAAASLTLLELPNLLAMLAWSKRRESPKRAAALASQLERLLANLDRPQELAQASRAREQATRRFTEWSHAHFTIEAANIDLLWERGQLPAALAAARQLLERCQAAGSDAFAEAAYDLAEAHIRLGRALGFVGEAEAALKELAEAERRFETLAAAGDSAAERMAAVTLTESGYCLKNLGRPAAAAACYEEAIKRKEKLGDKRGMATSQFQLGTVRLLQQRYEEALILYAEARAIFESLGERDAAAAAWRQIATAYHQAGQFEQAERAYRQSLAIEAQQNNPAGEAAALNELGILYDAMERPDDAAAAYRQAADLYGRLQDQMKESRARHNLAGAYIKLQRYGEARAELRRAIECGEPFGHAAQIWMTWSIFHDLELELASRHAAEAAEAREQARRRYLAYRRDGGANQSPLAQLHAFVAQAILEQQTSETEQRLAKLAAKATERWQQAAIAALQAILRGARDPALARDPDLDYMDAVELQLLLEKFGARSDFD